MSSRGAAGVLAGALALAFGLGASTRGDPPLLVTVGDAGPRSAVIWARATGPGQVTVRVGPAFGGVRQRFQAEATAETDFTVKLTATHLVPATRHAYRIAWAGEHVDGDFVTAPEPEAVAPVSLVWSGDLGGAGRCRSPADGYVIFGAMAARRPDFFVFVGDTVYADQRCPVPENVPGSDFQAVDLAGYRAKHRYNRSDRLVQAFLLRTSVYAIWDDHEVTNDFAGSNEPLMPTGRQAFLDYWPIEAPGADSHRLYRHFRWGRLVDLFILDTRQYRSPNAMPDGPAKTMLGAAQRDWLLAGLRQSDATWKLLVSSVPLSIPTGRAARDSWAAWPLLFRPGTGATGFEHELLTIVQQLRTEGVRNVVWLAADVHRAEVIRYTPLPGLVFYELVAGPLRAGYSVPGVLADTLHPTRLYAEGGFDNFGELRATDAGLEVRIIDAGGVVRFETTLAPRPER